MKKITSRICLIVAAVLVVVCGRSLASDEFTVQLVLRVENGNFSFTRNIDSLTFDQAGQAADMGITSASTATNTLPINNVTVPYYCFFRNLSASNSAFVPLTLHLRPGDVALLPVLSTNMTYFTTNSAANLEYWVNQE